MNVPADRSRWARTDAWIGLFSMGVGGGLAVWLLLNDVWVTMDDGFYYLKIAQNVASGRGSTFDGVHATNGYHPLWLLSLVPLFWLFESELTALAAARLLQGALMAATVAVTYRLARRFCGRAAASGAALLWVLLAYPEAQGGLEYSLHALSIALVMLFYVQAFHLNEPRWRRDGLILGGLCALAFLARLDTILMSGCIAAALLLSSRRSDGERAPGTFGRKIPPYPGRSAFHGRLQGLLAFGLPLGCVIAAYFVFNEVVFDRMLPLSGEIKRTWSADLLQRGRAYREYGWLAAKLHHTTWPLRYAAERYPLAIAMGAFAVPATVVAMRRAPLRRRLPLTASFSAAILPFALYAIVSHATYVVMYHGAVGMTFRYYVVQPMLVALAAGVLMEELRRRTARAGIAGHPSAASASSNCAARGQHAGREDGLGNPMTPLVPHRSPLRAGRRRAWRVVATAILLVFSAAALGRLGYELWDWRARTRRGDAVPPLIESAAWIRDNLPATAVVGSWNAGAIGFLSRRRVINLDGLANDTAFFRLDRHDLCTYWSRLGVTHLADVFPRDSKAARAWAGAPPWPAYERCADALRLVWWNRRYDDDFWRAKVFAIDAARLRVAVE